MKRNLLIYINKEIYPLQNSNIQKSHKYVKHIQDIYEYNRMHVIVNLDAAEFLKALQIGVFILEDLVFKDS